MFAVGLGLLLAGCTVTVGSTSTTEPRVADDALVVSTTDGGVVVYRPDGTETNRFDSPSDSFFRQPTWLDETTVVFSEVGDHALTSRDVVSGEVRWRSPMESSPFFFAPAPFGSDSVTTSLRNNPLGGLLAELIDGEGVAIALGDESPFYTAWAPDGERLAINLPGDRLDVWTDGASETILASSNGYQAPVWLDRGLVVIRDVDSQRYLSVWQDGVFDDIALVEGSAAFVGAGDRIAIKTTGPRTEVDPDGVRAAMRVQKTPSIPTDTLVVVDLETGRIRQVTEEPTAVFQLDPEGERLLYAEASAAVGLEWSIWGDESVIEVAGYRPNVQWIGELVPFFDQYAQSVQFWSDSGNHVAFPASIGNAPVVIVYDIATGSETIIEDATWSSWATAR